jgi:hypothetical protein
MGQTAELFEPGEYLDTRGPGWFSLAGRPGGIWREKAYPLAALPVVVNGANPSIDTWITQAVFNTSNRRAVNMQSVGLMFADLDTYHVPNLAERDPEEQAQLLAGFCIAEEIPLPSIVVFSGRGLQAKWLLAEALGPVSLHDWNMAQNALVRRLEPFAADINAKDISRVLRLERTVNTKSGQTCRVVYTSSGMEKCLARYDFDDLHKTLTGRLIGEAEPVKVRQAPITSIVYGKNDFSYKKLNWFRLYDIRDLWKARGGVPEGFREVTLFWELNFLLRAEPGRVQDLWKEAEALAGQIDPASGWYKPKDLSTLYRKAQDSLNGATVDFKGKSYPALYTPRNATLAEIFKISADEERELRTIISQGEKYRRKVEKRRSLGIIPRSEYEAGSLAKVKPWEAEGISRPTWYRRQARP